MLALWGEAASRVMGVTIGARRSIARLLLLRVLRELHTGYPGARARASESDDQNAAGK